MEILLLSTMLWLSNQAPRLFVIDARWYQWPYPQQRKVMEYYKKTGIIWKLGDDPNIIKEKQ